MHLFFQIHSCFCVNDTATVDDDLCDFGLVGTRYSSWEPAFLLHHTAIDRLFVMRRELEEQNGLADWTESRVIGQFKKVAIWLYGLTLLKLRVANLAVSLTEISFFVFCNSLTLKSFIVIIISQETFLNRKNIPRPTIAHST